MPRLHDTTPDIEGKLRELEKQAKRIRKGHYSDEEISRPPLPKRPNVDYRPDIPIDFDDLIEVNYESTVEEAVAAIPRDLSEGYAREWAWNASDELAIEHGCRFDLKRAMHYAYTLRNYFVLWEGRWSGEPFILRTWQPECLLRIFGWVRPHDELIWNRRFSKASVWTCKKHGKSPTGAATGLYLWKYDGVWDYDESSPRYNCPKVGGGQHVFCMAKNGKQAGIVWKHAANMVKRSPVLKEQLDCRELKCVESWKLLKDEQTFAEFTIVTGETKDELDASEGLNAAGLLVDEAHVVSDRQVEVLTDAGTSQEQFLWFQFSTYGDEEGYGKKDLEYGRRVIAGLEQDDAMFFKTYEAPQDLTDQQCGEPEFWKMANPNLGFTVPQLKFEEAYQRAKDDPVKFAGWKRRRLNIWQRASNPMLNLEQWEAGAKPYDAALPPELKGVGGGTGLDLAASEDWASLAHACDNGDILNIWACIWVSWGWIEKNSHRADFQKWAQDGHLRVHDGEAVDFEEIQQDVYDFLRHTRSGCLGYDKMFGMQMAQNLQRKLPQVGIYKFSQGIESYAVGTAELKAAMKNKRLRQPGNPAIDWQASHVQSKVLGDYEKPVKDENCPWKKIDSIQAIIMAIDVKRYLAPPIKPYVRLI